MELSKRILIYRIAHNIIQKDMAKLLGISGHTLCDVEQNKKVSQKTLIKIELKLNELERK